MKVNGKSKSKPSDSFDPSPRIKRLALTFIVLWSIIFISVPKSWIGLKDGYYYSLWIKTFAASPGLQDINGTQYVSYPFYWFWVWGQIYRLFGWHSPSNVYAFTAIASYTIGIAMAYWYLRKVIGNTNAYLFILFFELFFIITNQVQIWQKPHEHFAFLVSFAVAIYLANKLTENSQSDFKKLALSGIVLGFSFGVYTPPVVLVLIGLCVYSILNLKQFNWKRSLIVFVTFILVSGPQIFVMVKTYLRFHTTPTPMIYQITEFFPTMWIPVWLLILIFVSMQFNFDLEFSKSDIFLKVLLTFFVVCYLIVQVAYLFNRIINRSDIVLIGITVCILWISLLHLPNEFSNSKFFEITTLFLISIAFLANTTPLYPGADTDFRSNYEISVARSQNPYLIEVASIYEKKYCGLKVFSNDELRFLPASTKCRMPMTLPFNEGNTGPDIPYQERIDSFSEAVSNYDAKKLSSWFDKTQTKFISLVAVNNNFEFEFLINKNYPISGTVLSPKIVISDKKFIDMLESDWVIDLRTPTLFVAHRIN